MVDEYTWYGLFTGLAICLVGGVIMVLAVIYGDSDMNVVAQKVDCNVLPRK